MNLKPERKNDIISASLRVIEKNGFHNLTTKNIAKEVGITEPGIYRHFKSKQDILVAILEGFRNDIVKEMNDSLDNNEKPINKIGTFYRSAMRRFQENPLLTTAIFSEEVFRDNKKLAGLVLSILETTQDSLRKVIRMAQANGTINRNQPDDLLSLIIMGAYRILVTKWRLTGRSFDIVSEGEKLWETLRALIASPLRT